MLGELGFLIISASRRTDIPAFYPTWFMNRIREGFCFVPNPFNPKQVSRVSLLPNKVDAFVFWSKNPEPMLKFLDELDSRGFIYYFQYTLNDYPKVFEPSMPNVNSRIDTFKTLSNRLGSERVLWRYDPIIISSVTDYDFHASTFERLAYALRGLTRRVVISIVDLYRKTGKRMAELTNHKDIQRMAMQRGSPGMLELLSRIAETASAVGMKPLSCAEDYSKLGIQAGSCIDSELINSIGGRSSAKKDPGQRIKCRCTVSRDIGMYDTCVHGCPYCYSTGEQGIARQRYSEHNPELPMLARR